MPVRMRHSACAWPIGSIPSRVSITALVATGAFQRDIAVIGLAGLDDRRGDSIFFAAEQPIVFHQHTEIAHRFFLQLDPHAHSGRRTFAQGFDCFLPQHRCAIRAPRSDSGRINDRLRMPASLMVNCSRIVSCTVRSFTRTFVKVSHWTSGLRGERSSRAA